MGDAAMAWTSFRGSLVDVEVGEAARTASQERSDFSEERWRMDCARYSAALAAGHQEIKEARESCAGLLDGALGQHFQWLLRWHKQILVDVEQAVAGDADRNLDLDWSSWRLRVSQVTEEVASTKRFLDMQSEAQRLRNELQDLESELRSKQSELGVNREAHKAIVKQRRQQSVMRASHRHEAEEQEQRQATDVGSLERQERSSQETLQKLREAEGAMKKRCSSLALELDDCRRLYKEPLPSHLVKSRLARLKEELLAAEAKLAATREEVGQTAADHARLLLKKGRPLQEHLQKLDASKGKAMEDVNLAKQQREAAETAVLQCQRSLACEVLQRRWRGRLAQIRLQKARTAAQKLQASWRQAQARRWARGSRHQQLQRRQTSATALQCAWRSAKAKEELSRRLELRSAEERKDSAAISLQSLQRRRLARKEAAQRRLQRPAISSSL